ncbi:hypothetical protein [Sporolactobacillus terrae]|uniref:hypothetical protein n=1 Tax=Sporolactobacillus terrae TaxID=269673 RepID=UPI0006885FAD|nr:hypothetical protein [Sporolactobacillus terrae]
MTSYFEFKGEKSIDYGLTIKNEFTSAAPERDVEFVHVPGKSGDLIIDHNSYKNYDQPYDCNVETTSNESLDELGSRIKGWLQSSSKYGKLVNSWNPDYFRWASCVNALDIAQVIHQFGSFRPIFNCKPFRYSLIGDQIQTITAPKTITNPEKWTSLPYMKIFGSGDITLHINDQEIILTGISDYIEIDSELQSAFKGTTTQNTHYRSAFWPILNAGGNQFSWTGSVDHIELKPRWNKL